MIYIINHMTRFHKAVIWIILRHMLLKDGTIAALGQRLKRQEKEVQHRGEERAIA